MYKPLVSQGIYLDFSACPDNHHSKLLFLFLFALRWFSHTYSLLGIPAKDNSTIVPWTVGVSKPVSFWRALPPYVGPLY